MDCCYVNGEMGMKERELGIERRARSDTEDQRYQAGKCGT
jgi:hypothetical protein